MIITNDIYFKIDSTIVNQGFWEASIEEKKQLIDIELKNYIVKKIQEARGTIGLIDDEIKNYGAGELLEVLASIIPEEQCSEVLRHFIHYIIQVAGNLQNHSIAWWQENDEELITSPFIEFNNNNLWSDLKTHENTDYVQIFNFVYSIFTNQFMVNNTLKKD